MGLVSNLTTIIVWKMIRQNKYQPDLVPEEGGGGGGIIIISSGKGTLYNHATL